MNLTQGNLERLVATWKPRLGLDGWEIHLEIAELDHDDDAAEATPTAYYRRAKLTFSPRALELWPSSDLEHLVVHELLHVATRGIRQAAHDLLDGQVHRDAWSVYEEAFRRELEGEIDRLAIALVAAFRP